MSDDNLLEALRELAPASGSYTRVMLTRAADEIDRLRKEALIESVYTASRIKAMGDDAEEIERLRAEVGALRTWCANVERCAEDATEYVLASVNERLRAENAELLVRLRLALEAEESRIAEVVELREQLRWKGGVDPFPIPPDPEPEAP